MTQTPADVLAAYAQAIEDLDLDAFTTLYDEDATIFDAFEQWQYRGTKEWREWIANWFEEMPQGGGASVENVSIVEEGNLASVVAEIAYFSKNADGSRGDQLYNRYTATFRRAEEGAPWKILVEHTSLPIDGETLAAKPRE